MENMSREGLLNAYRKMRQIREFEERLHKEFATGEIPGFVHLYSGEEAVAVGFCEHLNSKDKIASTHRGHGHCIAKGVDIMAMMAEIYGKKTGSCGGKGGSMHIADLDLGMLGANGIVGAGPPLACGAGLAAKLRKDGSVSVVFFGDGAANQGTNFESMNLAVTLNLPVIFVLENNGYAESTSPKYSAKVGTENISDRARGFGMPAITVDGNDFSAVYEAAAEAIDRARKGGGPSFVECKTLRYYGHFEGDAQTYRPKDEVKNARTQNDPLKRFAEMVTAAGLLEQSELEAIDKEVLSLIDKAVTDAKSAPAPDIEDLLTDVYVSY
ncbi:MAG: thiamine pyrophosphate-dependent dehydrogenase E1 component subunit alpha [Desulfuromonadales bacterium]|nr:thiamine pyrophosphate-dependent dehydrogenase E1 component subunit alpha [Desulfuromonadales bacterium]